MTTKVDPKEAAARALYERNVPVGPSWDQLGVVTKSTWLEDVQQREAKAKAVPASRRKSK